MRKVCKVFFPPRPKYQFFLNPISPPPKYKPMYLWGASRGALPWGLELHTWHIQSRKIGVFLQTGNIFGRFVTTLPKNIRPFVMFFYPIMNILTKTNFIHLQKHTTDWAHTVPPTAVANFFSRARITAPGRRYLSIWATFQGPQGGFIFQGEFFEAEIIFGRGICPVFYGS